MSNEIQVFSNLAFGEVRVVVIDDEPWFVGVDVTTKLGYQNGSRDINRHVDTEDRQNYQDGTFESPRGMTVINESGLYALVLGSKLPTAKMFKRWVTKEILPQIRKTGGYNVPLTLEQQMAQGLLAAQKVLAEKEAQITEMKPKALFADAVATSKTSILIGDLAKILKANGVDTGQKRLFQWMRDNGYLIKSGSSKNMPTQRSMELGLFEIKETTISNPDGSIRVTKTTKVTGKGQQYFINKFLKEA